MDGASAKLSKIVRNVRNSDTHKDARKGFVVDSESVESSVVSVSISTHKHAPLKALLINEVPKKKPLNPPRGRDYWVKNPISPNKHKKGSVKEVDQLLKDKLSILDDGQIHSLQKKKDKIVNKSRSKKRSFKRQEYIPQCGQDPIAIGGLGSPNHPETFPVGDYEPQVGVMSLAPSFIRNAFMPTQGEAAFNVGLDDDTRRIVTDLTASLSNVPKAFSNGTSIRIGPSEDLVGRISTAGVAMDFMVLAVVVSTLMVWKPKSAAEKAAMVLMVVTYVGARGHLTTILNVSGFMDWATKPVNSDTFGEVLPEMLGDTMNDVTTVISGLLSSYMCVSTGRNIFKPAELTKVVSICGRMKMGVKSITDAISVVTAYVHSAIDSWYKGNPYFLKSGTGFIDEYLLEAKRIILLDDEKKLFNLQSSVDKVKAVYDAGEHVAIRIPGSQEFIQYRNHVNNIQNELLKIKRKLIASNFKFSGTRQEPVAIMFRGPPGAGKSQAMVHLSHAVNAATLSKEQLELYEESPGTFSFPRYIENDHWDGFTSHTNVCLIDDMLQATDASGNPTSEGMEAIRMINIFENQLHIAALEGKGNTAFRAKFVIANTNKRNFDFESICEPGAFLRRWDIVVDVIPKPQYCIDPNEVPWRRRFNPKELPIVSEKTPGYVESKHKEFLGVTMITPECCDYYVQKYLPNSKYFVSTGEVISFPDVIQKTLECYALKSKWSGVFNMGLDATLARYKPIYDEECPKPLVETDIYMDDLEEPVKDELLFDYQPEMGGSPSKQEEQIGLQFSLSERFEKEMVYIKSANSYNALFVECSIRKMLESSFLWEQAITPDEAFTIVSHVLREKGIDPTAVPIPLDFEEFVAEIKESFSRSLREAQETARGPFLERLFAKTDDLLKSIKAFEAPSWVTRIGEIYKYTAMYISNFARSSLKAMGVFMDSFIYNNPDSPIWKNVFKIVASTAAFAAAISLVVVLVKLLKAHFSSPPAPESDIKSGRIRRAKNVKPSSLKPHLLPEAIPHSFKGSSSNLYDVIKSVQRNNCYELFFPRAASLVKIDGKKHERVGYCVGLKDRILLLPNHFMCALTCDLEAGVISFTDTVILMKTGTGKVEVTMTAIQFAQSMLEDKTELEDQDLALLNLPKTVSPFKDIMHFIAEDKHVARYTKVEGAIYIPSAKDSEFHMVNAQAQENQSVGKEPLWQPYVVKEIYAYKSTLVEGDCGSLLFVNDNTSGSPLIGMHVAGIKGTPAGFAARVNKGIIERALQGTKMIETAPEKIELTPPENILGNLNVLGVAFPQSAAPRSTSKSKIAKSPMYGLVAPVVRAPAKLAPFTRDDVLYEPMEIALKRYCQDDKLFDKQTLEVASESLLNMLENRSSNDVERKVLTFRVAVEGDDSGLFDSLARGTSAGYPYNVLPGGSTKARIWGTDEKFDFSTKESLDLQEEIADTIELAKKGYRCKHYYTDHLKDERRSLKKVEAGETRLISAAPLALLVIFRMLFGAFFKWLMANKIVNGMALGINEYSSDWDTVARLLMQFGRGANIGAGDYRGFDMAHKNPVAWAILQIINDWYADGYDIAREVFWLEIVNSFHLNMGRLIEWKSPLPSGAPPTPTFNCLANHLYMRYAAFKVLGLDFNFNKYVYLIVLGDDHVFSVHPAFIDRFNEKSVQSELAVIGQEYTPEDKSAEFGDPRRLEDVTFLKRKWLMHKKSGKYEAPLDIDTIVDMMNWNKKGPNSIGDTETIIATAFEELCLHSREVFDYWKLKIVTAIRKAEGISQPSCTDYDVLFSRIKQRQSGSTRLITSFPDYDEIDYKNPGPQVDHGRFEGLEGSLFSDTPRMPYLPEMAGRNPGNPGPPRGLIQPESVKRIATNQNTEATGLTEQSVFETQRVGQQALQNSDTTCETPDADTPYTEIVAYKPLEASVLDQARTGVTQDVKSFLAKPVIITTGIFQTTDAYSTFLYSSSIPQALLYSIDVWKQKVQGNFAFKGTLVLTLTVNATRFQQGRYIMAWCPSAGGENNTKWFRMHAATRTQATQLPHVELDINCDSEATIKIPHVTCQGWAAVDFPGSSTYGNNGTVFIAAYSPLQTPAGSTNCGWTLLGHWEDVEVAMPVNPQMDRVGVRVKKRVKPSEIEQDSQGLGPLSGALAHLSTSASYAAGIPFLSSVATPVSWATDILAKAAKSFGWSRPHNAAATTIITRTIVNRFTNADVADPSTKLGGMDSNELEDLPGFAGTDLDEMSLNYVASISAYYSTLNWTMSQTSGSVLLTQSMGPKSFYSTTTVNGALNYHLTPLAFVTNFFGLYRGSIKMTIKFVKTEFHTGRLMLTFYPSDTFVNAVAPAPNMTTSAYCHREIVDIRYGNEFTFIMPFMSLTPYRSTYAIDDFYGILQIAVLNELEAPSVAPNNINMLLEVSAGPDFEWAEPIDFSGNINQLYVPEMARNKCSITDGVLGNGEIQLQSTASRLCIGERIMSFRTLARRFTQLIPISAPTLAAYNNVRPFMVNISYSEATTSVPATYFNDYYTLIGLCYAMSRGSMRIKFVNAEINATCLPYAAAVPVVGSTYNPGQPAPFSWSATPSDVGTYPYKSHRPAGLFRADANGGVEIEFPAYNRTHSYAMSDVIFSASVLNGMNPSWKGPVPRVTGYVYYSTTPTVAPLIYRAVGEDHSFGLFCSVPPIIGYSNIAPS